MKVNKLIIGLSLVLSMSSFSCESEVLPNDFTHRYPRTQCADPWGHEADENKLFIAVKDYLKDKGIEVLAINKFPINTGTVCLACTCLGNEEFKVKVSVADGEKLIDLNDRWEAL